jgi:cell division protein FtsI/penicillin-binding protein 2
VTSPFQSRCITLLTILVIGLSVLSWRLVQIQLVDRKLYAESSRKAFYRVEKLPALRGMIVDSRGEPIAKSLNVSTLFIDRKHLDDAKQASYGVACKEASSMAGWEHLDRAARKRQIVTLRGEILERDTAEEIVRKHKEYAVEVLARPLGMKRADLMAKIENGTSRRMWFPLVKDMPGDDADSLREVIDRNFLQGFEFQNSIKRWYSSPNLATHLTGYTGEVDIPNEEGKIERKVVGRSGIEQAMQSYLEGHDGWLQHHRDARGLVVPGKSSSLMPPRAGLNVKLTIDMGLQAIVEEEMDACLEEFKSERGSIILMNPKNGEILAMASRPHFDLNLRNDIAKNGFNFSTQATYEPGSTFKIVATAAAINEGIAKPSSQVFCHNGKYFENGFEVPDHHGYGYLTLEGVLAKSSNIGAYKFAKQLGSKRFYDYVSLWGFGKKTGILLDSEGIGIARDRGNPVDFSRASYGYALNVTPLQMACAYSVIAGDGRLLKPKIVKSVEAQDDTVVETFPDEEVRRVLKPETARQMREAMIKTVEPGGTATQAAVPGYKVSGKTGTAKRVNPNGPGYLNNSYTVSFAGMMPAQDPVFVGIVVIDDPRTTSVPHYGGTIAAPVFGRIAARAATYLNLPPTEPVNPSLSKVVTP